MKKLTNGANRTVFLVGRWAIKVPTCAYDFSVFLRGWLTNRGERQCWRDSPHKILCPVVWSCLWGMVIVMPRCMPLHESAYTGHEPDLLRTRFRVDYVFDPPIEDKMDSVAYLDGRLVAVDYGYYK